MTDIVPLNSVIHHFVGHVCAKGAVDALYLRRDGREITINWHQIARDVVQTANALESLGVKQGDRVATFSPNRYEWVVCDLAILGLEAVHVPIHNSLTGPQARFQIVDSGSKVVIIAGEEQGAKLAAAESLPEGVRIASIDPTMFALGPVAPPTLAELAEPPDDEAIKAWNYEALKRLRAPDVATILYTSGTTGEPKGVILTHGNIVTNAETIVTEFDAMNVTDAGMTQRRMNMLPLSHIFARTCDLYGWIVGGSELALADSPQTAIDDLQTFRPTHVNAVPYFYERVMRKLIDGGEADVPGALTKLLGGRIHFCCSGGAPLPLHLAEFFQARGVLLTQGYGLTETSPVITMNTPQANKVCTVGRALPGIELRIAADGEIVTRGPNVMQGYWNRPEETKAALVDGWFHTGDVGELDDDGYLKITGRKKELIVTTGGKKIVPAAVEALLTADPLVRQAIVVGEGRDFVSALLVPDCEALAAALVAAGHNVPREKLLCDGRVVDFLHERLRPRLQTLSPYERPRKFALLEREMCLERGELTLTMKLRRTQIAANYADVIDELYRTSENSEKGDVEMRRG